MPQSKKIAEFLSPLGNPHGGLRTDFDALRRERVLVLNDTINTVSRAGETFVSLEDAEGQITVGLLLHDLIEELDASIFEAGD